MLRASSLGLRCYRHTLHHGALRCPAQLSLVARRSHGVAAQATPSVPGRSWSERLVRESGSFGSEASKGGGCGDGGEAEEAGTVTHAPAPASGEPTFGSGPAANIQPVQPRSHVRTYTVPERVKIVPASNRAQELEAERLVRIRFEKSLPVRPGSVNPTPAELPASMAIRPTSTRGVRERLEIKPLQLRKGWVHTPEEDEHRDTRAKLLNVLATAQDVGAAWDAYYTLMSLPRFQERLPIPWQHLHRLTRLIASVRPRTRALFIRLLSVISTIHRTGGTVQLWQWNALLDFAGKGWRKTTPEAFRTALDVYHDLISNKPPGACFSKKSVGLHAVEEEPTESAGPLLEPDIWTFTTILNIAISTSNVKTVRHAAALLESSGQRPNAVTYLSYIRYYTKLGRLLGVRSILAQMVSNDMELGLDGTNACIWAFGRNNRLDIAEVIYKVLRSNISQDADPEVEQLRRQLAEENIRVPHDVVPDHITYTCLVQAYAYRGHLEECLTVFMDMITALDPPGKRRTAAEDPEKAQLYLPVYRAIFIGFVRHGQVPRVVQPGVRYGAEMLALSPATDDSSPWALKALDPLFEDFLRIPRGVEPTENLIFWILTAFAKTSGEDKRKLRRVYRLLEERFGGQWGGRLERLREVIFAPDSSQPSVESWDDVNADVEDDSGDSID